MPSSREPEPDNSSVAERATGTGDCPGCGARLKYQGDRYCQPCVAELDEYEPAIRARATDA